MAPDIVQNVAAAVSHSCSLDADARSQAERQAVNSACQGSAADLVKLAMIQLHKKVLQELPADSCKLLLQVSQDPVSETPTGGNSACLVVLDQISMYQQQWQSG